MRADVLGPLVIRGESGEIPAGSPQQQALLVALVLRRGAPVTAAELIDELWDGDAPATAAAIVRTYVHRLRRSGLAITSSPHGYSARATLDLDRFEELVAEADRARTAGDRATAAARLREGLDLWRGPALAGVVGPGADRRRVDLDKRHRAALVTRLEIDLERGLIRSIEPELYALVTAHPLDEHLRRLLMTVLYRLGRQADAMATYHECRRLLDTELGVDPGPELQDLYTRMLRADPELMGSDDRPRPAQLPAVPAVFVGREHELRQDPGPAGILVIAGLSGVGKTTLALRWAHQHASRFDDGQLYADLCGYDPGRAPAEPADVLHGFLLALGVPAADIPADPSTRAGLFRTTLAGRRMLILLDNARSAEQVKDLLPGGGDSIVLVTSRGSLYGLIARTGARLIRVRPPDADEAIALVAGRLGARRAAAEPAATRDIVELCGRLPLALTVVAARAVAHEHLSLATIADELRGSRGALDALRTPDAAVDVRAALSWSYDALAERAAEVFRLLGTHPGPDLTADAASALLGRPVGGVLTELASVHLLDEHRPGRYTMHDLVRDFARETAGPEPDRAAARRMLDYYLHTSHAAAIIAFPSRYRVPIDPPVSGVICPEQDATWFDAEYPVLLAVLDQAARLGFDRHAWQLAWVLRDYLNRQGLWHHLQSAQDIGMAAAERTRDPLAVAHSLRGTAHADTNMGRFQPAVDRLRRALAIFTADGDREAIADCRRQIVYVLGQQGDIEASLAEALQVLGLYPPGADPGRRATALNAVSWNNAILGRFESALAYAREAIALGSSLGPYALADTYDTLGYVQAGTGDLDAAEISYRRAVEIYRGQGAVYRAADSLRSLAERLDTRRAQAAYREALALLADADDPRAPALIAQLEDRLRRVHES
jgi:DNA-binding SARP family transcriptional activator/tetratricopeptide (TPR) repeat protein